MLGTVVIPEERRAAVFTARNVIFNATQGLVYIWFWYLAGECCFSV
jgi:hypothetical protein